ncbi:MAG TPA: hypothetical protein VK324_13075 [Tepidisphaeraceae bacterium]|nr:hypothetical protein [Tepidisphaeraceae bacterium]
MASVAPTVPAESDLLCERCGYTLNGLPESGNCPECGTPVGQTLSSGRRPPAWERRPSAASLVSTAADVTFRPTRFFRTLATRSDGRLALWFARAFWAASAALFSVTAHVHMLTIFGQPAGTRTVAQAFAHLSTDDAVSFLLSPPVGAVLLAAVTYAALSVTTRVAARLTHYEATRYHGLRLPLAVVLRGMHYHAAHYLPVAVVALVTVCAYRYLVTRDANALQYATRYLWALAAEVVVAAGYLFHTYWIGMRNMMYANR